MMHGVTTGTCMANMCYRWIKRIVHSTKRKNKTRLLLYAATIHIHPSFLMAVALLWFLSHMYLASICVWNHERSFTSFQKRIYLPGSFSKGLPGGDTLNGTNSDCTEAWGTATTAAYGLLLKCSSARDIRTITNDWSFSQTRQSRCLQEYVYVTEAMRPCRLLRQLLLDGERSYMGATGIVDIRLKSEHGRRKTSGTKKEKRFGLRWYRRWENLLQDY